MQLICNSLNKKKVLEDIETEGLNTFDKFNISSGIHGEHIYSKKFDVGLEVLIKREIYKKLSSHKKLLEKLGYHHDQPLH